MPPPAGLTGGLRLPPGRGKVKVKVGNPQPQKCVAGRAAEGVREVFEKPPPEAPTPALAGSGRLVPGPRTVFGGRGRPGGHGQRCPVIREQAVDQHAEAAAQENAQHG